VRAAEPVREAAGPVGLVDTGPRILTGPTQIQLSFPIAATRSRKAVHRRLQLWSCFNGKGLLPRLRRISASAQFATRKLRHAPLPESKKTRRAREYGDLPRDHKPVG